MKVCTFQTMRLLLRRAQAPIMARRFQFMPLVIFTAQFADIYAQASFRCLDQIKK